LHDATLLGISVTWADGLVEVTFRVYPNRSVRLLSTGVVNVSVTRSQPWGPSESVNEIRWSDGTGVGLSVVEIEIQSGDSILIEANRFSIE
jgi:hypothetical protein